MIHRRRIKWLVVPVLVSTLLVGCEALSSSGSQLEPLVGYWDQDEGPLVMRIDAEGIWAIDQTGRVDSLPVNLGTITFDGKTATITMSDKGRSCEDGDMWVWEEVEFIDDDQFRLVFTVDDCVDFVGERWSFTRCIADSSGGGTRCERVK